ncbi:MAG: M28 family peptidase [Candidatus Acidiferrales bacterium]
MGVAIFCVAACGHNSSSQAAASSASTTAASAAATPQAPAIPASEVAPPPSQTGGFDGAAAYRFTSQLVAFGPRPPASDNIRRTQEFVVAQLKSFGCPAVDTDEFHANTPAGSVAMKNIVAKIPGSGQGIILLLTHYDTDTVTPAGQHMDNFVGADDGGSSSGLLLEIARILCGDKTRQPNSVWIAFLDGEEAFVDWNANNDNTYGSRQMAASMAESGELKRVKAVLLADMVGPIGLRIRRDESSTPWLTNLVWKNAERLGYQDIFVAQSAGPISDDHLPFTKRNIPSVDVIDLVDAPVTSYWHTPQDTMDKISPRSLAIVGHVFMASIAELQQKFR